MKEGGKNEYIDQLGDRIVLKDVPRRIVSLVPSQTELLYDLGLKEEIVGITRYCIHPEEGVRGRTIIGGTKQFDLEKIRSLSPDLIIGNKEENYQQGILALKKEYPVWMSDINELKDAYEMIGEIGAMVDREAEARKLVEEICQSFTINSEMGSAASCAYFIWRKPYMVAGRGTFIDAMMRQLGVVNAYGDMERYPEISPYTLRERAPDLIFLSSEPYAFSSRHYEEFLEFAPSAQVIVVDGELFSWYGSRLRYSAKYFGELRETLGI